MDRSNERVQILDDIITGISRRSAYKFKTKDVEDLKQDLWIKILEKEEAVGYNLDLDLIAKICYDRIVDLQRYESRRNAYSFEGLVEDPEWGPHEESMENKIVVSSLFKLFPEGSKERVFLEYWGTASGIKDFGFRPEVEGRCHDGFTENNLAYILGFGKASNRSYKNMRNRVRQIVSEYINENE